jgi:small subunit ribosomal protein S21
MRGVREYKNWDCTARGAPRAGRSIAAPSPLKQCLTWSCASIRNGAQYKQATSQCASIYRISLHGMGVNYCLAEVTIQEGESLENALRRFKRKVQQEDIIKEIKKHSFYMKPGERRRAKEALSRKRLRKKQRREQD